MDEGNLGFAEDMRSAFGDDRFYHALNRAAEGDPRKVRPFYVALRGDDKGWAELCREIKLRFRLAHAPPEPCPQMDEDEYVRDLLCHAAYIVSTEHKQFARRDPTLPPNVHARMLLDLQNQWTRKYAEGLARQAGGR